MDALCQLQINLSAAQLQLQYFFYFYFSIFYFLQHLLQGCNASWQREGTITPVDSLSRCFRIAMPLGKGGGYCHGSGAASRDFTTKPETSAAGWMQTMDRKTTWAGAAEAAEVQQNVTWQTHQPAIST